MRKFVVTINGNSYEVGVEEIGADETVVTTVQKAPVTPSVKTATTAVTSGENVVAPFPGLVKKFLVEEGASVKKDQPIIIFEAMKMDNDIVAPCDGKVSFKTSVGSNVETDTVLAIIG